MKKLLLLAALSANIFTYAQNVGVDVATPLEKLDVLGAIRIGNTSNTNAGTIRWNSPNFEGYNGTSWQNFGGGTVTGSGTTNYLPKWTSSTALGNSLIFDNGTNVGIGTSSPAHALHVVSTQQYTNLRVESNFAGNTALARFFSSGLSNGQTTSITLGKQSAQREEVYLEYYHAGTNSPANSLNFGWNAIGDVMSLTANGNLGIGTTTPANKLDVEGGLAVGTIYSGSTAAPTNGAIIQGAVGIGTASPSGKLNVFGDASGGYYQLTLQTSTPSTSAGILLVEGLSTAALIHHEGAYNTGYLEIEDYSGGWATTGLVIKQGNIGVGNLAPAEKLDVTGKTKTTNFQMTASPTNNYVLRSDASGNANWADPNTLVTGLLPSGTSGQTLRHDGANWVANSTLCNNGTNVGIGTSSPGAKLHIEDPTLARVYLRADPSGSNIRGFFDAYKNGATEVVLLGSSSNHDLSLWTNSIARVIIKNDGNVGIGVSPSVAKLEIAGQVKITGGTPALNQVLTSDATGLATWEPAQGDNLGDHIATGNIQLNYYWLSNDGGNEGIRVDNNGNVGVGIEPSGNAYLDITGTNAGTTSLQLRSGNTQNTSTSNQMVMGYNGTENYRHAIKTRHNSLGNANNAIDFYVWDFDNDAVASVGTQQVMTITSNNGGSVGIGTTTPGAQLEVAGQVKITGGAPGVDKVLRSDATGLATWVDPSSLVAASWNLTGNASTVDGTNFIGTTDNVPFNIRVNNQKAGRIDNVKQNAFYGHQAGNSATSGISNTFIGDDAGYTNSTTGNNTFVGTAAGYNNNADNNTFVGTSSGSSNTSGTNNSFFGFCSGYSNINGSHNTASGYRVLNSNISGSYNSASGHSALYSNSSGYANTASGYFTLYSNTTGDYNTASGIRALYFNTTGDLNTAIGYYSLYSNVAGHKGTAIGTAAMYFANNTAIAFTNYNVAVGYEALRGSTDASANTGNNNTALGYQTLWTNSTGSSNTAIGKFALYNTTSGGNNTAIGNNVLNNNVSGNNNTAVGYNSGVATGALDNATAIGANAVVSTSNSLVLGNNANVGIGTTAPTSKLQVVGLPIYANNAAAVAGGLTVGAFYRTGGDPDLVCVVH